MECPFNQPSQPDPQCWYLGAGRFDGQLQLAGHQAGVGEPEAGPSSVAARQHVVEDERVVLHHVHSRRRGEWIELQLRPAGTQPVLLEDGADVLAEC